MATINGTTGNDVIVGTTADDVIQGGAGNDRINGGAGADLIYGGEGADTLTGDAGNDVLYGGNGNDGFFGGGNNDSIYGEAGDDVMYGDAGDDTLVGGDGNDKLYGGTGNDTLMGGAGANIMDGGSGVDTIVFELSAATLTDAVRNDLVAFRDWIALQTAAAGSAAALAAQTTGASITLAALGATLSTIEAFKIVVDGVETALDDLLNQAPVAAAAVGVSTDEDAILTGAIAATDANGDTLAYSVSQGPAHGALTLNSATGAYSYVPGANFNGADSFKVVISDGRGGSTTQDVTIAVAAVNDAPVSTAAISLTTDEDQAISGQTSASDVDGDNLVWSVAAGPQHGSLALNAATGEYVYTPAANYNGADAFQLLVSDGAGGTAVQDVTVAIAAVNDAPVVATTASNSTNEDVAISGAVSASDVDGDALSWSVATGPQHGSLALNAATGEYVYTPDADFNGADAFQVLVSDGAGGTAVQDITVAIAAVNDAPAVAATASKSTNEDVAVTGTVVATDVDGDTLSYAVSQGPAHGVLSLNAATGAYTYTPAANYNGSDTFRVLVSDGNGGTAVQDVTVAIAAVNDAPIVAATASKSTNEDVAVTGTVVATDVDGDTLSYAVSQGPAHGVLSLNAATGAYSYTPAANYNGSDTFRVLVSDGNGGTAVQDVTVAIAAVNDAPIVAATASKSTIEDTAVTGTVSATDIEGQALTYAVATAALHGLVSINAATGAYTYAPTANYSGADSFDISVTDALGATSMQRVSVAIAAAADAPSLSIVNPVVTPTGATSGLFGASASGTVIVALEISAALADLDGSESLSIRISNVPTGGVLSGGVKNADGSWTLTASDLNGLTLSAAATNDFTLSVTATSTESTGATATSTASILIDLRAADSSTTGSGGSNTINGTAGNDRLSGGGGNDTINGANGADWIDGGSGNDSLYGGAGNDVLFGGNGKDTFYADAGNDVYNGGSGTDILTYAAATSGVTFNLTSKVIYGTSTGVDAIDGENFESIIGSGYADNYLGSSSIDTFNAGAGNDTIRGAAGADILTGGAGADTFNWKTTEVGGALGVDHITDFSAGDMLDFRSLFTLGGGALSDYVRLTDTGANMTISAKIGAAFVDIAILDGVQNKTVATLFNDGQLLVV